MSEIFVLMSFLVKKNGDMEDGVKYWFSSLESAIEYLEFAGKTVDGYTEVDRCVYDDPFECRWNYVVIEKVHEGPMSTNEVMGWWEAVFEEGNGMKFEVKKLDKCPVDHWDHT